MWRNKGSRLHGRLALALGLLVAHLSACSAGQLDVDIVVPPEVKTVGQDSYICTTLELPTDKPYKLVGVEPLAEQSVVHHILLFGCDIPGVRPKPGQQSAWECKTALTCAGTSETVLYGWGRNAPRLDLPEGVGFSVGKGSAVTWIIVQVHYLGDRPPNDKSGVRLRLQDNPVPYSGGLLSYASFFTIPPGKQHHLVENNCCYRGFQPLTTFAVRVHTHSMGRQVLMTRHAPGGDGSMGHIVAAGDPQKPQGFNPVSSRQVLWPGERLSVICDFDSTGYTMPVGAGPTHDSEMCNMYLMVYSALPHIEMCNDGSSRVDESTPGNMPRAAALLPDPFPLWATPNETTAGAGKTAPLGDVTSVALGPDGTLWALYRGGRAWGAATFNDATNKVVDTRPIDRDVVVQMHPDTGKVLRAWGAGHFVLPHMITVDRNNSVWVTDVGRHQAMKFTASGKFILAVGSKFEPGDQKTQLCKPTQVWPLNDGDFLVSDGYCNSRVVRYRPDGSYRLQYQLPEGKAGAAASAGGTGVGVAHSVVAEECDRYLLMADRENGRVVRFDLDTKKVTEVVNLSKGGRVWALAIGPYGRPIVLVWDQGSPAVLVDVNQPTLTWPLPDSDDLWPHDLALGPAALPLTGAGDRLLAVYVAPLCAGRSCGPAVKKFILFPRSFGSAPSAASGGALPPPPVVAPAAGKPVLAHLGGHHPAAQAAAAAAGGGAAAAPERDAIDVAGEARDEEEEREVEQREEADDEDESKEMAEPSVVAQLQQQLAALKQQLKEAQQQQQAAGGAAEAFETLRTPSGPAARGTDPRGAATSTLLVVVLSALLGTLVGAFAMHVLREHTGGGGGGGAQQRQRPAGGQPGGPQPPRPDEELPAAESEHSQLLNGHGKGHANGHSRGRGSVQMNGRARH